MDDRALEGVRNTPSQEVVVTGRHADYGSQVDLSVEGTAVGGRAEKGDVRYISSREDAVAGRRTQGKIDSNLVMKVVSEGRNNLDGRAVESLPKIY